jgi:hypothetical protein
MEDVLAPDKTIHRAVLICLASAPTSMPCVSADSTLTRRLLRYQRSSGIAHTAAAGSATRQSDGTEVPAPARVASVPQLASNRKASANGDLGSA